MKKHRVIPRWSDFWGHEEYLLQRWTAYPWWISWLIKPRWETVETTPFPHVSNVWKEHYAINDKDSQ